MPLSILYEDNHLLVVDKPAGITTQEDASHASSLVEECRQWIKRTQNKPGRVFLQPIHRLDKPVSGIVVFSKTSKALARLQKAMREGEIHKTYWAVVEGILANKEGSCIDFLVHADYRSVIASKETPEAKYAELHYHVHKEMHGNSLLSIELVTGRYHQIRIQWSSRGHPILGDKKYNGSISFSENQIALHHRKIVFPHPIHKSPTHIVTPLPKEWEEKKII